MIFSQLSFIEVDQLNDFFFEFEKFHCKIFFQKIFYIKIYIFNFLILIIQIKLSIIGNKIIKNLLK